MNQEWAQYSNLDSDGFASPLNTSNKPLVFGVEWGANDHTDGSILNAYSIPNLSRSPVPGRPKACAVSLYRYLPTKSDSPYNHPVFNYYYFTHQDGWANGTGYSNNKTGNIDSLIFIKNFS